MPETETIQIAVDQLRVSLDEIGRYVGGSRYKLDEKMKALAEGMLEKTQQLVKPVFNYAVHAVEFNDLQKGPRLESGSYIEVPEEVQDTQVTVISMLLDGELELYGNE